MNYLLIAEISILVGIILWAVGGVILSKVKPINIVDKLSTETHFSRKDLERIKKMYPHLSDNDLEELCRTSSKAGVNLFVGYANSRFVLFKSRDKVRVLNPLSPHKGKHFEVVNFAGGFVRCQWKDQTEYFRPHEVEKVAASLVLRK